MNIPERYMVSLASDQFYEMRVELDEAIKAKEESEKQE